MEKYRDVLLRTGLFADMQETEIYTLLHTLDAKQQRYAKNEVLVEIGDSMDDIIIVLCGAIGLVHIDALGNETIAANRHAGNMLCESEISAGIIQAEYRMMALTEAEVLQLSYQNLVGSGRDALELRMHALVNISREIARSSIEIGRQIGYMKIKSMRKRIYAYLLDEQRHSGKEKFDINLDRTSLAQYLNVDRSALSRELSRMRQEGLIDYEKNTFIVFEEVFM